MAIPAMIAAAFGGATLGYVVGKAGKPVSQSVNRSLGRDASNALLKPALKDFRKQVKDTLLNANQIEVALKVRDAVDSNSTTKHMEEAARILESMSKIAPVLREKAVKLQDDFGKYNEYLPVGMKITKRATESKESLGGAILRFEEVEQRITHALGEVHQLLAVRRQEEADEALACNDNIVSGLSDVVATAS